MLKKSKLNSLEGHNRDLTDTLLHYIPPSQNIKAPGSYMHVNAD